MSFFYNIKPFRTKELPYLDVISESIKSVKDSAKTAVKSGVIRLLKRAIEALDEKQKEKE